MSTEHQPGQPAALPPLYVPPDPEPEGNIRHSLFGEILDWMLAPLLLLWPMSIAITYLVAKSIANQPFDHALEDRVAVLAEQVARPGGDAGHLPDPARAFLRADDTDAVLFQIARGGAVLDGDRDLPAPAAEDDGRRPDAVRLRNEQVHGTALRIAHTFVPQQSGAPLVVQVAETLDKRASLANEIIKGVILPQFIILPIVLALVWFALARGLSPLAELQWRIRARRPDDLSPIDARKVPEEITPLVGSLNDMLSRLGQSIDQQKRFIADAAHQMKTPLAGMRMQSELALRQRDAGEIQRSLEQLARSSESATRLVNQLLALARAENQPQAGASLEDLDLAALARECVQDWVAASLGRRIDLGFEAPATPVPMRGNPVMLRELLSNLVDNALRYTPEGGSVTVRVRGDGERPVLEVEDTGPGIPASERAQVFERFYRILGTGTQGSGLGLAIVREIAMQHGAEVDLFNNPRSASRKLPGALFRLTFPAPAGDDMAGGTHAG